MIIVGRTSIATVVASLLRTPRYPSTLHIQGESETLPTIVHAATLDEAAAIVAQSPCDQVIIAGKSGGVVRSTLIDVRGKRVAVVPATTVLERQLGRLPLEIEAEAHIEDVTTSRHFYTRIKRALDVTVAVVGLVATLPLLLLVMLIARIASGSPVIDRQQRIGRGGRTFELLRMRSRLGGLPLLWNLLRGDLTLVGPRPESPEVVAAREDEFFGYAKRHSMRPGLTGWAQISAGEGMSIKDAKVNLEYDLYYLRHASIALDLNILFTALGRSAARTMTGVVAAVRAPGRRTGRLASALPVGSRRRFASWKVSRVPKPGLERTLLVGAGAGGKLLTNEMLRNPGWGFWPVAFVDDDPGKIGSRIFGLPVLGETSALPAIVEREQIDIIVIAIPSASTATMSRLNELSRRTNARVLTMPHIGALLRMEAPPTALRSIALADVLGRPPVAADVDRCRQFIAGRRVLITGAAGSIGQELTRQVAQLAPTQLVALDVNESGLFDLQQELALRTTGVDFQPIVMSVTNARRLASVFAQYRPEIVFHAAAYKHVPLMEEHPEEAVMVNAVGTFRVARAAAAAGAERLVLVSTDKAVRPSSVMGATKRVAELAVKMVSHETQLSACCVRFGNVLGSRGSVIPTFERQIDAGGPVRVTDPEMRRFFMTIPEAASLIIQAGAFGDRDAIYMLDMGEEVSILELAERMIRQRGLRIGKDIEIVFTGSRPGEKLREELALESEVALPTTHPKIRILAEPARSPLQMTTIANGLNRLGEIARIGDPADLRPLLFGLIAEADGSALDEVPMSLALHLDERHRETADALNGHRTHQRGVHSQAS